MIRILATILTLTLLGDAVATRFDLPVPGSTLGLLVLFGIFVARGGPDGEAVRLFDVVAPHFPLFFVPAAAGLIANTDALIQSWLFILTAIGVGTPITLVVTGVVIQGLLRLLSRTSAAGHSA